MRHGLVLVALFLLAGLAGCGQVVYAVGPANWSNLPGTPPANATDTQGVGASAPSVQIAAKTVRLYQGDPSIGWDSHTQYEAEWRAACGPTAMTVVLWAWGFSTGVGTTLDRLRTANAYDNGITSLEQYASVIPVYHAGVDSTYYYHLTDTHLEAMTDAGYAVLVDIWDPEGRYYAFQPGHWLTVIGHDPVKGIRVRDSSHLNLTWITWDAWNYIFTHRAVLIHQKGAAIP